MKKLNILVIGGTGFIGRTLSKALLDAGHSVAVLSRRPALDSSMTNDVAFFQADVTLSGQWQELIPDFDIVISLVGVSIFRRWTAKGKQEIIDSRVVATRNIVDALRMRRGKVHHFFSVSGVGYYGFHGDEILDEDNPTGSDFLARLAAQWEEEAEGVKELGIRPVICRLGHVLGRHGGVMPKLVSLANLHLASHWGSGDQWISWIHEDDLARAILFLMENPAIIGPVNVTAPNPVRNREMMQLLAEITHKRVLVPPIPEIMLRLMTGEFASVFVNGQRVLPRRLIDSGFSFKYPTITDAYYHLLTPEKHTGTG
ncbi:TIGR01777 family oxidoreductase [Chloroflexota bacterium]